METEQFCILTVVATCIYVITLYRNTQIQHTYTNNKSLNKFCGLHKHQFPGLDVL